MSANVNHLKDITGTLGSELDGKRIALCVTASVSITEAPRIARLLMRHGADVVPLLTPKASEFVSPMIFEWSTGNVPITKLTGRVEHVELVTSNPVDLVLIAPCTANTLAKVASGISNDPVSALACTALGSAIPILVAEAMHEPMLRNPVIQSAREKLERAGVRFLGGRIVESKSKLAEPEEIVREVISLIGKESGKPLSHISLIITAGATREPIDSVRYITNASTGKMGVALAEEAAARSARKVCLITGPGVALTKIDKRIEIESVVTTQDMLDAVLSRLASGSYNVLISAAAPVDYSPLTHPSGKIRTSETPVMTLELGATKKIISVVKEKFPSTFVVAFKAEYKLDNKELISRARDSLNSSHADLVVANNVGRNDIGFGSDYNEVFVVGRGIKGEARHLPKASKCQIAKGILDALVENFK